MIRSGPPAFNGLVHPLNRLSQGASRIRAWGDFWFVVRHGSSSVFVVPGPSVNPSPPMPSSCGSGHPSQTRRFKTNPPFPPNPPFHRSEKGGAGGTPVAGAASNRPHLAREAQPARTERRDGEALAGWGSISRRFPCGLGRWGRRRRVFDTILATRRTERVCRGARAAPRWCRRWGAPGGGRDGRCRGKRRALDTAGSRGAGADHAACGGARAEPPSRGGLTAPSADRSVMGPLPPWAVRGSRTGRRSA